MGADYANTTSGAFNPSTQASSSTDANAYGSSFQWGRGADGHEFRNSGITSGAISTPWTSTNFIENGTVTFDWRTPQDDNLWVGVSGTNNPCPIGYRVPTEAEFLALKSTFTGSMVAAALASPLKLTLTGTRSGGPGTPNGSVLFRYVGTYGHYWSSTVSTTNVKSFNFTGSPNISGMSTAYRLFGRSIRCIKD